MEGSRLNIVAASDPNYMRALETAISVGQPMLLKVTFLELLHQRNSLVVEHSLWLWEVQGSVPGQKG